MKHTADEAAFRRSHRQWSVMTVLRLLHPLPLRGVPPQGKTGDGGGEPMRHMIFIPLYWPPLAAGATKGALWARESVPHSFHKKTAPKGPHQNLQRRSRCQTSEPSGPQGRSNLRTFSARRALNHGDLISLNWETCWCLADPRGRFSRF